MTEIILMIFILCVSAVNMLMIMDMNDTPQYSAMDMYNQYQQHHDDETVVIRSLNERLAKLENNKDLADSLQRVRLCLEDMETRLEILEDSFKYHIQSTDELKPKA